MLWRGHCAIHSCWGRGCGTGPNRGKLELQLPKAAVGGLNRSLLGCMDLRTKRLEQAAAVGTVTTLLHLLISPVFVIQEGFKIGRTYKFVLHMSQDGHLPCPAVSKAHRHQFLSFNRDISENHTTKPALSPVTPVFPSLLQAVNTSQSLSLAHKGRTCRKEQVVPMVTSRVTLPRRSCTFPDFRMSSLPT